MIKLLNKKTLKIIPFFFGLQKKKKFDFFGIVCWFFKNIFFFKNNFFFFQNIILWFCLVLLLKKKSIIFLSNPTVVEYLQECKITNSVLPSTIFKASPGLFSNFNVLKWFCFYYKIPTFLKKTSVVWYFDFMFPMKLISELRQCKILSAGFYVSEKRQQLYPNLVFALQLWYSKRMFISKNFLIFLQGLKQLTLEFCV